MARFIANYIVRTPKGVKMNTVECDAPNAKNAHGQMIALVADKYPDAETLRIDNVMEVTVDYWTSRKK